MKKFDVTKSIQLALFIILSGIALAVILTDAELYQLVGRDPQVRTLCILLWVTLALSFVFILIEFSLIAGYKKQFRELDFVVHSDHVSGIANRYSCDAMIEKYLDRPLPRHIACIMIDLTNIQAINQQYGHLQGNSVIRDFSAILQKAATDICFVGRNGGNKFLALFENYDDEGIESFLAQVKEGVDRHNAGDGAYPMEYKYGVARADRDPAEQITNLISLSNSRIYSDAR